MWKYLRLILGGKSGSKIGGAVGQWCQVLDGVFGTLGVIEEKKSPCGYRGFWGIG